MNIKGKTLGWLLGTFEQFPEIEKAVLFGSKTKGLDVPHSDIDIALFFNESIDETSKGSIKLAIEELASESDIEERLDIVVIKKRTSKLLLKKIEESGKQLYVKVSVAESDSVLINMYNGFKIVLDELDSFLNIDFELDNERFALRNIAMWRHAILSTSAICFERSWKIMRKCAKVSGLDYPLKGSRDAIRAAKDLKLIADVKPWFENIVKRNDQIHDYGQNIANETLAYIIKQQIVLFKTFEPKLKAFIEGLENEN